MRISAALMDSAHLLLHQAVDIREEQGQIIIERVDPEACDLAALVAGITDENKHDVTDTGAPLGREVW